MQMAFTNASAVCRLSFAGRMQEFESAREDIKNKNTEDLNVMKITLESTIDELEKKFEISHEAYLMQVWCDSSSGAQILLCLLQRVLA